jgi:hypothetical protein
VAVAPVAVHVDHDVARNSARNAIASVIACATASGSSPLTWKTGVSSVRAMSVA